jgi:(1->4)-alpha-D-glucan 1-alpha-D-glucosylmutase
MPRDVPIATYRLQLTRELGFGAAAALVPYLKQLGISHLYASPFLKARAGSTHGYDIVDHAQLNPEFGGDEAFAHLSQALAAADMALILDFVPNHMGVGFSDNAWWLDVLEWGPKSPHAASFDIDWDTLPHKPEGGVLLPILGRAYGDALEAGEITLAFDAAEGSFSAWYFEHRLPIRPNRYGEILRTIVAHAEAGDEPAGRRLLALAALHPDPRAPTRDQAPAFKAALAAAEGGSAVIERGLAAYRPTPDHPARTAALHRLLERQHYRLASWRVAAGEINYRRFFDVNDLAGLRMEDARTFIAVHRLVATLIAGGQLHGLRIDHIDGLWDPPKYFRQLQRLISRARGPAGSRRPFYLIVEKILAEGEALPRFAGVAGSTGYEWLNAISRLLIDPRGLAELNRTGRAAARRHASFEETLEQSKRRVLDTVLASEFTVLARLLTRIAAGQWRTRDFALDSLRAALELFVIHFPVYRTYVTRDGASPSDRATIARAIDAARAHWFGSDVEIFDFLQDALTLDLIEPGRQGYSKARVRRFALKVQQFTGPMMAKSMEDTAFYRYVALLALNEVGGDPTLPALAPADFHRAMTERARISPHGLTATATHDTKRGEDARARLLALSELGPEWAEEIKVWNLLNDRLAGRSTSGRVPSYAHEYMLYQTLVGAWPTEGIDAEFTARLEAYALKAAREGKLETSWTNPNAEYEAGLAAFVRQILDRGVSSQFLERLSAFARRVALIGALNSLVQLTLKATMPGVPDFYQGTELWDLSMVDPDNRRPVDFTIRRERLARLVPDPDWKSLGEDWADGSIKLALTRALLALRAEMGHVFTHGDYRLVKVTGSDAGRIVAFTRTAGPDAVLIVAARHLARLTDGGRCWPQTFPLDAAAAIEGLVDARNRLAPHAGVEPGALAVSQLFGALPVAILHGRIDADAGRQRDRKAVADYGGI